jgi:protocatechuate 3,4-dioxygenase beta subunit
LAIDHRTDSEGRITLRGVLAAHGTEVPITAEIGGTDASEYVMRPLRTEGGEAASAPGNPYFTPDRPGRAPGAGDRGKSRGSAAAAGLRFLGFPQMSDDYRPTAAQRRQRELDARQGRRGNRELTARLVSDRAISNAANAMIAPFTGWFNSHGKARVSLNAGSENFSGSADFFFPFYDSEKHVFFGQIGARTMAGDRIIGHLGLGYRVFPFEGGNTAFGINAFVDQDITRNHTRGSVGGEFWHDWIRLSGNYYFPLSGWKRSAEDYPQWPVMERPAGGYDFRLSAIMPFYPALSIETAYEKWKGEHVGTFDRHSPNSNPAVYSVGLKWQPVPLISLSGEYRKNSTGRDEARFMLAFNYDFDKPASVQLDPDAVAGLRSIAGSRHDFVNRQYEMPLEYKSFNVLKAQVTAFASGIATIRITDGFGDPLKHRTVKLSAPRGGVVITDPASGQPISSAVTDGRGEIRIRIVPDGTGQLAENAVILIDAGDAGSATVTVPVNLNAFALSAAPTLLYFLVGVPVEFTLVLNGEPAPAGMPVTLFSERIMISPPGGGPGQPVGTDVGPFSVGAGGRFYVNALTAVSMSGLSVTGKLSGGVKTDDVQFMASSDGLPLALSSAQNELLYFEDNVISIHLLYGGNDVPAGTKIHLVSDGSEWENAPDGIYETDSSGNITVHGARPRVMGPVTLQLVLAETGQTGTITFPIVFGSASLALAADKVFLYSEGTVAVTFKVLYHGQEIPAGTLLKFLPEGGFLQNPPPDVAVEAGSTFTVDLRSTGSVSGGPWPLRIGYLDETSNAVLFRPFFDNGNGDLVITPDRDTLSFGNIGTGVSFDIMFAGRPVPAGISLDLVASGSDYSIQSHLVNTSAEGKFGAELALADPFATHVPFQVTVSGALESNTVYFDSTLAAGGGTLELTADPSSLEIFRDSQVEFTLLVNGQALPANTVVTVNRETGNFRGLGETYQLGSGSRFTVPAMAILVPDGNAAPVSASVTVNSNTMTSADMAFAVTANGSFSAAVVGSNEIEYMEPAEITLALTYDGEALPELFGVEIGSNGTDFANQLTGTYMTDANGHITVSGIVPKVFPGPARIKAKLLGTSLEYTTPLNVVIAGAGLKLTADKVWLNALASVTTEFSVVYGGNLLPTGTELDLVQETPFLQSAPAKVTLNADGKFSLDLMSVNSFAGGPWLLHVAEGVESSNSVEFRPLFNNGDGDLAISASTSVLGYLTPTDNVWFQATFNEMDIPAGITFDVAVTASDYAVSPATVQVTPGSLFSAHMALTRPFATDVSFKVTAMNGQIESNEVLFESNLVSDGGITLTLIPERQALEFLESSDIEFTVLINGQKLPEGTPVSVYRDTEKFSGLDGSYSLDAGSKFKASGLVIKTLDGDTAPVSVGIAGPDGEIRSDDFRFIVTTDGTLGIVAVGDGDLVYMETAGTELAITYSGAALPGGLYLTMSGDGDDWKDLPSGPFVTGSDGHITVSGLIPKNYPGEFGLQFKIQGTSISGTVNFNVVLNGSMLTLTANKEYLNHLAAEEVEFTVLHNENLLPAGTVVIFKPDTGFLKNDNFSPPALDAGGKFTKDLQSFSSFVGNNWYIHVEIGEVWSNNVGFSPFFNNGDGDLEISTSTAAVNYGTPASTVSFHAKFGGREIPAGFTFDVIVTGSDYKEVPSTVQVTSGGTFTADLALALPFATDIEFQVAEPTVSVTSNAVKFDSVLADGSGTLDLSADSMNLEFLKPTEVEFTVLLDGLPLPTGTLVTVDFDPAKYEGLSGSYTLGAGSKFTVPDLAIETLDGSSAPISVKISGNGHEMYSNQFNFGVTVNGNIGVYPIGTNSMTYMETSNFVWGFECNGNQFPPGISITVSGNNVDYVDSFSLSLTTDDDGHITVPDLTPKKYPGPLQMEISIPGAGFTETIYTNVVLDETMLTLEANKTYLNALNLEEVEFTVKHNGNYLPSGTVLNFKPDPGFLQNSPPSTSTLDAGGIFTVDLQSIDSFDGGPWHIHVERDGVSSDNAEFLPFFSGGGELVITPDFYELDYVVPSQLSFTALYGERKLPPGFRLDVTADPADFLDAAPSLTVSPEGEFQAVLSLSQPFSENVPYKVKVDGSSIESNTVRFRSKLIDGSYSFSVDTQSTLIFLQETSVDFTLYMNGYQLPDGTEVTIGQTPGSFAGLDPAYTIESSGKFTVNNLAIQLIDASAEPVTVSISGPNGSPVSKDVTFVTAVPGDFTLTPDVTSIGYRTDTPVKLYLTYEGKPVPAGTAVTFDVDGSAISGIPSSALTGAGGQVTATLQALLFDISGYPVKATIAGKDTDPISFNVDAGADELSLSTPLSNLAYLESISLQVEVLYNGKPLPEGTVVHVIQVPGAFSGLLDSYVAGSDNELNFQSISLRILDGTLAPISVWIDGPAGPVTSNEIKLPTKFYEDAFNLEADGSSIAFLENSNITFAIDYDGTPLPVGTEVTISGDPATFAGLPATVQVGPVPGNVILTLQALLSDVSPYPVRAIVAGQESNGLEFSVIGGDKTIYYTLNPYEFEFMVPQPATFTVYYNAVAVPAGTVVTVNPEDQSAFGGLAPSYTAGEGGQFTVDGLLIRKYDMDRTKRISLSVDGPIGIIQSFFSDFRVNNDALKFQFEIDEIKVNGTIVDDFINGQPADVVFRFTYNGYTLPDGYEFRIATPHTSKWDDFPSGNYTTDVDGHITVSGLKPKVTLPDTVSIYCLMQFPPDFQLYITADVVEE